MPLLSQWIKKTMENVSFPIVFLAQREGFEPPETLVSTVFKTAAIDHSTISAYIELYGQNYPTAILLYFSNNKMSNVFATHKKKVFEKPSTPLAISSATIDKTPENMIKYTKGDFYGDFYSIPAFLLSSRRRAVT